MKRLFLLLTTLLLPACGRFQSASMAPPPTAVPIVAADGAVVNNEAGPLWVLLSGVDEHGLIAEHDFPLLQNPDANAPTGLRVHSGVAAAVHEIRHAGPNGLQRFYRVQTVTGASGWISDYYVRRIVYLFDPNGGTVPLYAAPDGPEVARLANVSPVTVKVPTDDPEWWLVRSTQEGTLGWVPVTAVKESPVLEYLLNQQHEHR